jgi:2-dehydro-3-deoxyphosphogluconate aldolase/(4S)-4-hydroxy-2-oxoglutarate aldolase
LKVGLPEAIVDQRIIAVARGQDRHTAADLARALAAGGLAVLEITVEGGQGIEAIAALAAGPAVVGAGTITTMGQATAALDAGASFLVSPHLDVALVSWAHSRGVPFIPGVFTPTEIQTALAAGAPAVKLFPASLGGPALVRALVAPYPDLRVIPTGGVDDSNAGSYLEAGALAVGVGGWLTGGTDLDVIEDRARALASIAG